jgi:hypothetical protein
MMIDAIFGDGAMCGLLGLGIITLACMVSGLRKRLAETNKRIDGLVTALQPTFAAHPAPPPQPLFKLDHGGYPVFE